MTENSRVMEQAFEGKDLIGRRLAIPWQPDAHDSADEPDVKVSYGGVQSSSKRFATVQAGIDYILSVHAHEKVARRYVIEIGRGYFEGPVIVPANAPPLLIRGAGVGETVIAASIDAMMTGAEYASKFSATIAAAGPESKLAFARVAARQKVGTGNTAVFRVCSEDAHLSGLSINNLYDCDRADAAPTDEQADVEGRFSSGQHQAVALMLDHADKTIVRDCALSSFQDTLYLKCPSGGITRSCFYDCLIEGDVDFIFGGASAYFEKCTIRSRGVRGAKSWALAPSTSLFLPYGFMFHACDFQHDGAEAGRNGTSFLSRQWFEGVRATPYGAPDIEGYSSTLADVNRLDGNVGTISNQTLESVGKMWLSGCSLGQHLDPSNLLDSWGGPLWSPRYRPAQTSLQDLLGHLNGWLDTNETRFAALEDPAAWLDVH